MVDHETGDSVEWVLLIGANSFYIGCYFAQEKEKEKEKGGGSQSRVPIVVDD